MENDKVKEIIDELHIIKNLIFRDKEVFDKFVMSSTVRYLSLFFGAFIFILFLGIYIVEVNNISLSRDILKYLVIVGLVVGAIVGGIIKLFNWKAFYPDITPTSFLHKVLGVGILKILVVILVIAVFLCVYFSLNGLSQYILPTVGISVGTVYLIYSGIFYNSELEVLSYYIIITSLLSIFFIEKDFKEVYLWTSIVFGIGLIIFFVLTTLKAKKKG